MAVRVKICGVTRVEDAAMVAALGAEMIGVNFFPASPRYLTIARARQIATAVGARATLVGVFVNADRAYIEERMRAVPLGMLQFHGDEDDGALAGWPVPVIRAVRINSGASVDLGRIKADYVLLDTFHRELFGGTGVARSLADLCGFDLSRVIISGGLQPGNAAAAAALRPHALDVASGVESAPGVKDHDKLRSFILNAKSSG